MRRIPVPHLRDNERATQPAALLLRVLEVALILALAVIRERVDSNQGAAVYKPPT
jgi:hypothetical protein